MARRTAKKKNAASKTPDQDKGNTKDTAVAETPDGAALLADLEQRCVSLRAWHQQASSTLESREGQLNEQAEQLVAQQATLAKTHAQLNTELQQLAATHEEVEADRAELTEMRRELEAEWSALRNLRDAQAKLGRELDDERQRLNRRAFKLTTPSSSTGTKLKAA